MEKEEEEADDYGHRGWTVDEMIKNDSQAARDGQLPLLMSCN